MKKRKAYLQSDVEENNKTTAPEQSRLWNGLSFVGIKQ